MGFFVTCKSCGSKYRANEAMVGYSFPCKKCGESLRVGSKPKNEISGSGSAGVPGDSLWGERIAAPETDAAHDSHSEPRKKGRGLPVRWTTIAGVALAMLMISFGSWGYLLYSYQTRIEIPPDTTFSAFKKQHRTELVRAKPSPESSAEEKLPEIAKAIRYDSNNMSLLAWYCQSNSKVEAKHPAIVFLHSGFRLTTQSLDAIKPALDRGYAVLLPSYRGENGNPGNFELMYGEVDDAANAVRWLAGQPEIDATRIYVFGHGIGGGISALLSLEDNLPIQSSGSDSGLFDHWTFYQWRRDIPFSNTPEERSVRLLLGNTHHMIHQHFAYLGEEHTEMHNAAIAIMKEAGEHAKISLTVVPGDYETSTATSFPKYLDQIESATAASKNVATKESSPPTDNSAR